MRVLLRPSAAHVVTQSLQPCPGLTNGVYGLALGSRNGGVPIRGLVPDVLRLEHAALRALHGAIRADRALRDPDGARHTPPGHAPLLLQVVQLGRRVQHPCLPRCYGHRGTTMPPEVEESKPRIGAGGAHRARGKWAVAFGFAACHVPCCWNEGRTAVRRRDAVVESCGRRQEQEAVRADDKTCDADAERSGGAGSSESDGEAAPRAQRRGRQAHLPGHCPMLLLLLLLLMMMMRMVLMRVVMMRRMRKMRMMRMIRRRKRWKVRRRRRRVLRQVRPGMMPTKSALPFLFCF
eukprot:60888-Rhodomonas_salina.1